MKHIVALSGGKDSTAMALRLAEIAPQDYVYVCTPTGNELPEMEAHWRHLETLLSAPLKRITLKDGLAGLMAAFDALPNFQQRWCTRMLKIQPYLAWIGTQTPCVSYVGLRADEEGRAGMDPVDGVTMDFPMRRWGWGICEVKSYLHHRGVIIPNRTDCAWCYGQRLIEWYWLWLNYRALWDEGEAWEAKTGHTFRSPGRDTWPAALKDLAALFAAGKIAKNTFTDKRQVCRACSI